MKNILSGGKTPEQQARRAIRAKKWNKAIEFCERELKGKERDYSKWNLLGDLQFNNRMNSQAVESWRRALEGFTTEGLHENALGVARKILRRTPEEEDVHLLLAEAYIGLEYYADCLSSLRSYLKLARRPSESEIRAFFKKILDAKITHPHLLAELQTLYRESRIEDIELERRILDCVESQSAQPSRATPVANHSPQAETSVDASALRTAETDLSGGLMILDELEPGQTGYMDGGIESVLGGASSEYGHSAFGDARAARTESYQEELPAGEGKEHYDLGAVYREMKLWDAAVAEFEQARRDPSCRLRATLAMSECLQESNDLQSALKLLENERLNDQGAPHEQVNLQFQLGVIYQTIGKLEEALSCFERVRAQNAAYGDADERIAQLKAKLNQE